MNMFKRMMSFFLAAVLLVGMMPVGTVHAEETEPAVFETEAVTEETSETTEVTETTEETVEETEAPATTETVEETEVPETTEAVEETEVPETTEAVEETEAPETTVPAEVEAVAEGDYVVGDIFGASQEAANATSGSCGAGNTTVKWAYSSNTLTISGSGQMASYSSYSSVPWYEHRSSIKKVVISTSSTVTNIGSNAFSNLDALTTVTINSSVTAIGDYAFYDCDALTTITIPGTVKTVGNNAFSSCDLLETVTVSDGVTGIGSEAFYDCNKLTTISLPGSVTSVGSGAFESCDGLTSVSMTGVTSLENRVFYSCDVLATVTLGSNVTSIGEYAFYSCRKLTGFAIPTKVKSIGGNAFYDCDGLTAVTIPASVGTIGASAFSNCSALTSLTISSGVTQIGSSAFASCTKLKAVSIPDGVVSVGAAAFANCDLLTSVTIPASVTEIGAGAFRGCEILEEIYVNPGNTAFSSDACGVLFDEEQTLLIQAPGMLAGSYAIPETVTQIGDYAFYYCQDLTAVDVPDGVKTIGANAFYYCTSLEEVTLGSGVTSLGDNAFYYCKALTELILPEGLESIGKNAFAEADALTRIEIPASVTTLSWDSSQYYGVRSPFYGCDSLTEICVAEGNAVYASDADGVLYNKEMTQLLQAPAAMSGSYTTADTATTIRANAFYQCKADSVTLSDSVTTLESYAFSYSKIRKLTLSDSIKTIPNNAFYNSTALHDVDLGSGVTTIGSNAFYNCTGLEAIYLPSNITKVDSSAFQSCSTLRAVYIPSSVTSFGSSPFYNCSSALVLYCENSSQPSNWSSSWNSTGSYTLEVKWSVTQNEGRFWTEDAWEEEVMIPNYISSLPKYAFHNHKNLKKVVIPEGVTAIPQYAFYNCTSLTDVNIPSRVTQIGDYAFNGCTSLRTVFIPKSVITMAPSGYSYSPFYNCKSTLLIYCEAASKPSGWSDYWNRYSSSYSLTVIWDTPATAADFWLSEEAKQAHVVIPEGITVIPKNAFSGRTDLLSVTFPSTLTKIDESAFYGCSKLKVLDLPDGLTTIGSNAFQSCSNLRMVYIPESVTTITASAYGKSPFYGCSNAMLLLCGSAEKGSAWGSYWNNYNTNTKLTPRWNVSQEERTFWMEDAWKEDVVIPACITQIPAEAFYGRTDLKTVTIHGAVTAIGNSAFYGCTELKKICFEGPAPQVGTNSFYNVDAAVYYPDGDESWTADVMQNFGSNLNWGGVCAEGHTPVIDQDVAPTCTTAGLTQGSHCSVCSMVLEKQTEIPAKGHTEVAVDEIPATCTKPGYTASTICNDCGEVIKSAEVIPAGHKPVTDPAVAPTCTQTGLTEGSHCEGCGEVYTKQETVPAAHTPVTDAAVSPTCKEPGLTEGSHCRICGEVLEAQNEIAAKGHEFKNGACACGASSGTCGETLTWMLEKDGVLTISGSGAMEDYIHGYTPWFDLRQGIKEIVIGADVSSIGNYAFSYCDAETITFLGNAPDSIGYNAFWMINSTVYFTYNETWTKEIRQNYGGFVTWFSDCGGKHIVAIDEAVAPTCTETGLSQGSHCDACGEVLTEQTEVPASGHTEVVDKAVDPTCTQTGLTEGSHCSVCKEKVKAQKKVDKLDHDYENDVCKNCHLAKDLDYSVTEDEAIYNEYSGNAENLVLPETIAGKPVTEIGAGAFAGSSNLTTLVIPESVTKIGADAFEGCEELADVYYGGSLEQWKKTGAQTSSATNVHYAVTDPENHWETETVAPTCKAAGYTYEICACGYERNKVTTDPALPHTEVIDEAVAPTCTETGLTQGSHCSVCGETVIAQEQVNKLGHDMGQWVEAKAPTCTVPGTKERSCSRGDHTESAPVAVAEHDYENDVCKNCHLAKDLDYSVTENEAIYNKYIGDAETLVLPASIAGKPVTEIGAGAFAGSDLTTLVIPESVTKIGADAFGGCDELADVYYGGSLEQWQKSGAQVPADTNVHCGTTEPADHWETETVDPTCKESGYSYEICGCGYQREPVTTEAPKGHTAAVDKAVAPNCTETGLKEGSHCSVCGDILVAQVEIPALGHTEITIEAVPPTCTEPGFTEAILCGVCGETVKVAEVIPAAHKPVTDPAVAATCTQTGLTEGSHCDGCGEVFVKQEIIPITHAPVTDAAVEPTCKQTGLTEGSHCGICGEVILAQQEIPAKGHAFENGACACGAYYGTCGENLTWLLEEGVLTISGFGPMADYGAGGAPWYTKRTTVRKVVIGSDVTRIGTNAFAFCTNLKEIIFEGDAPAKIGVKAFWNVEATAYFNYNETWTKEIRQNYDGTITWFSDCGGTHVVVTDAAIAPTCTETGLTEGSHCDACGEILVAQKEVPAAGHTEVVDAAVAPTCTAMGLTEGKHCSVCGETVVPQQTVGMLDHDYENDVCKNCYLAKGLDYAVTEDEAVYNGYSGNVENLVLPETIAGKPVTEIGAGAFAGSNLTTLVIPESVTKIGADAFDGCDNLADVYYGGSEELWAQIGTEVSADTNVHFGIVDPDDHWETKSVEPTCEEAGYTYDVCTCGYERNKVITKPANGHEEIIDEAVLPTCTESGLTEGKHCKNCEDFRIAQEVIPATGHAYEQEDDHFKCGNCGDITTLTITREYILLRVGQSVELKNLVYPESVAGSVIWYCNGEKLDESRFVTEETGVVYITAELGGILSTPCRIDVADTKEIKTVQLSTTALAAELYSTTCSELEILLRLAQNEENGGASQSAAMAAADAEQNGVAIQTAEFVDTKGAGLNDLFELEIRDDRKLVIKPTEYAVKNPGLVVKSYTTAIRIVGDGFEATSEELTLTVKKTLPELKASISAFNSFYDGQSRQINITGGTVETILPNTDKTGPIPEWLTLEENSLRLTEDAPDKKLSAKAYLLVKTEEWRVPVAVTLSVKNTYKQTLKLSASAVTVTDMADRSCGVMLKLQCKDKKDTLAKLNVEDITAPDGYVVEQFDGSSGSFVLRTQEGFRPDTVKLTVHFRNGDEVAKLPLTVKTEAVKLKLSASKVSVNTAGNDSVSVTVSATPADYIPEFEAELKDANGNVVTDVLDVTVKDDRVTLSVNGNTPETGSYQLHIRDVAGAEAVLPVNLAAAKASVTYKAAGAMDLTFPEETVRITPTFKNYSGDFDVKLESVINSKKKDMTQQFTAEVSEDGKAALISCKPDTAVGTYTVKLTMILGNNCSVSSTVKVTVKRTAVKLKLSASEISLNKSLMDLENGADVAQVSVSCATANYTMKQLNMELRDGKGKKVLTDGEEKLQVTFADGKLTIALGSKAAYGDSYQLWLKADEHGAVSKLKISVLASKKSKVTLSLKAKGTLDVIRQSSAITLTPAYKNCTAGKAWEEKILIYSSADKYKEPVQTWREGDEDGLFHVERLENGSYVLTQNGAINPNLKYKVELVSELRGLEPVSSGKVSISVKMGSAKLSLKSSGTTLFAKDKYDRALVWFTTTDATLNSVAEVTIKDAKYQNMFEIINYKNGEFAIGYKDGIVHSSLIGKKASTTVTVTLNIVLEGNETGKANTTAKVKLTVVK